MLPKILTLQFQRSCIFIQLHSFSAFRVFQATWQCGGPPSGLEWDFTFLCEIHFLLWRICGDQLYPTLSCHQLVEWKASRSFLLFLLFLLILAHQSVRSVSPPGETFFIIFHHFSQACRNCCKAPEHPRHVGSTGPAGHGSDWAESHKMDVVSGCQPSVSDLIDRSGQGSSLGRGKRI